MKPAVERTRPRIGDVLEIPTPRGLAYVQYSHRSRVYGPLIRVLPGTFERRPRTFDELVRASERFYVFFAVGVAAHRRIVLIVAHEPVPGSARSFPLLRSSAATSRGRWVYDGERWREIDLGEDEYRRLSICAAVNDTMLIERIASEWSPEQEP